ncbi:hypothetical protein [uncultured Winogradskyella sp.]|uniref:hypothetical protein n=1 Tax=uncultured Winogradskyella sp. TaxID=395353 RepID=UPI002616E8D2|nr:hypothetical protein [uncultured Winogradskyella sp.]
MRKIYLLKKITLLLVLGLFFYNCTEENIEYKENSLEIKNIELEMTPALEKIVEMGFDLRDIIETKPHYIVEGDLMFPKELSFYENLQSNSRLSNTSNCRYGPSIVNTTDIAGNFDVRTIRIHSQLDPVGQINETPVWNPALNHVISQLNSISSSSCLRFVNAPTPFGADITIVHDPTLTSGAYAQAGIQSGDNPFPLININRDRDVFATPLSRSNTLLHEIIHCLGFNGHQGIDSIMYPDPASLGFDGLQNIDRSDFTCVYDNCEEVISNDAIISGPLEICGNSLPVTYSLDNTNLIPNWSVSNLILVSSNNTSITVRPLNNGVSSIGTITAQFPDGSSTTFNVNIIGSPSPNPLVGVSGPSILQYYQSGLFYTNENNFDNYNHVEWVVYSYNFPNAIQHFNIQSPAGNNEFNALIEVLPTAPPGNYVVQCRISNNCGTYIIEKNLEVKEGRPQLFDL